MHAHRAYARNGYSPGEQWTPSTGIPPEIAAEMVRRRADHTYSPPDAPDAEPVRELRRELRQQRDEHVPFDVAWPLALALIGPDLEPWREALQFARAEWRSAYLGEPPVLSFGFPDPWRPALHLDQVVDDLVKFL
jgi:hypothetical protein